MFEESVKQLPNGKWIWLDETWNEGDNIEYATKKEACKAQARYCFYELEGGYIGLIMRFYYWISTKIVVGLHRFLVKFTPVCHGWEGPCFRLGKRRRLCTAYVEEERNWTHQCQECYDGENQYYADLMKDMY